MAHKGKLGMGELVEGLGCELLYLLPTPRLTCLPDFNPIEEAFSKVKGFLQRAGGRTCEKLVEAMGRALNAVATSDAKGFFESCGYRATAQLL